MPERKTVQRQNAGGRAIHDVGGLPGDKIDREEHELTLYEKRVDALLMLLAGPKNAAFRVDALRRTIEDYAEQPPPQMLLYIISRIKNAFCSEITCGAY